MGVLKEFVVPALFAVFWIVFYVDTVDLAMESVLFPHILLGMMAVVGVLVLFTEIRNNRARKLSAQSTDSGVAATDWRVHAKPMLLVGLTAGYLIVFMLTNFLISTVIFLISFMIMFRVSWQKALAIGLLFPTVLYVIFALGFHIRL